MIEKITSGITNILRKSSDEIGLKVVEKIKSDFVRSPKLGDVLNIQNPIEKNIPKFSIVKSINSDKDLAEIHRIDLEAFAEIDPVASDFAEFKKAIKGFDSYVVKNDSDSVVAYCQIEPACDGVLYVNSMGVSKELRKTKASYEALKLIQENTLKVAIESNIKMVALHVDAENSGLLKMYKKFGFEVKKTEKNYFKNGDAAHYMEVDIEKANNTAKAKELVSLK